MPASLPAAPSLEHLRGQAKDLLKALRAGDPAAQARLRQFHPRGDRFDQSAAAPTLATTQLVIAREYGFPSWPRLKSYVDSVRGRASERHRPFMKELDYYQGRAAGFLSVFRTGQQSAVAIVRARHPGFAGATDDDIRRADLTMDDARLILAREHGFGSWDELAAHVAAMSNGRIVEPFQVAYEAIEGGQLPRLQSILRLEPGLVNARGTNGNTLLNLAGAMRKVEICRFLIELGADPNLPNNKGWTPVHQAAYMSSNGGDSLDLLNLLLDAGGRVDLHAHGDGGTPLVQALFWGNNPQAELLADRGILPDNLRVAAGLGRLDLLQQFFRRGGSMSPRAGAHREFHRPHSGFPEWKPSDDPQEILDEALVWAAMNGRMEAVEFLVDRGANVNADPYRGTPLTRAACKGHHDVIRRLIQLGAEVNRRGTFGGPSHGQGITALHIAAQNGDRATCQLLLELGADPTIEDELYHSTPTGWSEHFGHKDLAERLRQGVSLSSP